MNAATRPVHRSGRPCVYTDEMPRTNIYLDQALHDQVKAYQIAISAVCQKALREEITAVELRKAAGAKLNGANTQPKGKASL